MSKPRLLERKEKICKKREAFLKLDMFDISYIKEVSTNPDDALFNGHSTFNGAICEKHPELNGERLLTGNRCRRCKNDETKIWRDANPDKVRGYANQRRAAKTESIPDWLDQAENKKQIEELYRIRRLLEAETGEKYNVDHLIPLRLPPDVKYSVPAHRNVWWNMQVITKKENTRKSNSVTEKTLASYEERVPLEYRNHIEYEDIK